MICQEMERKVVNELATRSSDSGGTLAQAEVSVSCVQTNRPQLSELFVIDRQVLNPVAQFRSNRTLGHVNFGGALFDGLKPRVVRWVTQSLKKFLLYGLFFLWCFVFVWMGVKIRGSKMAKKVLFSFFPPFFSLSFPVIFSMVYFDVCVFHSASVNHNIYLQIRCSRLGWLVAILLSRYNTSAPANPLFDLRRNLRCVKDPQGHL